jgi:hypothetical protein
VSDKQKLIGKKAIDNLIAGEWEGLVNVVFEPENYEMDRDTARYFKRQVEFGLWLLQTVNVLRGGKGHYYSLPESTPECIWSEYEEWKKNADRWIDPVTAAYDKREREGK